MQSSLWSRVSVLGGLAFLVVLLAAFPAGAADELSGGKEDIIIPCENSANCNPEPPCIPNIVIDRMVTDVVFIQKKPNGVCVYECTSNETFTDLNMCLEPNTVYGDIFRVRPYVGSFPCPPATPGLCCDTEPRPRSCSW